ncbi:MAG: TIGR03790 family protein [Verrucomicrobiales bacterium]|jgi:uncharacterized protein (TIGR03790 family)|nr:TIGR03790 family protein [Verrucomicrobiales bacterium]
MNRRHLLFLLLLASGIACRAEESAPPGANDNWELPQHVLVVYNANDQQSKSLAEYYAAARQIPADKVLGIECPTDETISRKVYQEQIEAPINTYLTQKGWFQRSHRTLTWNAREFGIEQTLNNPIWCIVLIRGIPLRVAEDPAITPPTGVPDTLKTNAAAVDSELALLPCQGVPRWAFIPNPYYSATLIQHFSQPYADWVILVARLDAPLAEDVKRMIDAAISVEKTELTGRAYFDSRNITDHASGYFAADEGIRNAAANTQKSGFETSLDTNPEVVPINTPWDNAALYFGWYTGDCTGPFLQPGFRFRPGAIAYHIHSFSAETLRSTDRRWAGPLISKGAAATMGCVYEPYVSFTPNVEIFTNSLLSGLSFGEAAYKSQPVLSWMVTMVGDPLYRPYPHQLLRDVATANDSHDPNLPWLLLRLARVIAEQPDKAQEDKLRQLGTLAEKAGNAGYFWEGYAGILQGLQQPAETVVGAYQKAIANPESPNAVIRVPLKLADYYLSQNRLQEAFGVYESLIASHPKEAQFFDVPKIAQAKAKEHGWNKLSANLQPVLPHPNRQQ